MQGCGSDVGLSVEGVVMSERRRVNFKEVDVHLTEAEALVVELCVRGYWMAHCSDADNATRECVTRAAAKINEALAR